MALPTAPRAAIYARVSTLDQEPENQLQELRRYVEARAWTGQEYVDRGVSGAKDRRPALDQLMADAASRRIDVVVCWRLDRFGRNLRHLVVAIEELTAAGVAFVSMGESIDTTSPTGRLLLGVLGATGVPATQKELLDEPPTAQGSSASPRIAPGLCLQPRIVASVRHGESRAGRDPLPRLVRPTRG